MPNCGQPLLDTRRSQPARAGLDPRCDMYRWTAVIDGAGARAPAEEFLGRPRIGPAGVRVADIGRKEFEESHAGALAYDGDERRER